MITWTIILAGVLFLCGVAAVLHAMSRAPEGFEDERGFHTRAVPAPVLVRAGASRAESDHSWVSIGHTSTHAPHGPVGAC